MHSTFREGWRRDSRAIESAFGLHHFDDIRLLQQAWQVWLQRSHEHILLLPFYSCFLTFTIIRRPLRNSWRVLRIRRLLWSRSCWVCPCMVTTTTPLSQVKLWCVCCVATLFLLSTKKVLKIMSCGRVFQCCLWVVSRMRRERIISSPILLCSSCKIVLTWLLSWTRVFLFGILVKVWITSMIFSLVFVTNNSHTLL